MFIDTSSALPDPVAQPEFYDGVAVKRGIAWAIDVTVIALMVVPAVVLTAFVGLFFLPFLYAAISFVYRVLTIAGGSATWGMRLMAIELRDTAGRRLDLGQAFLHTLGYTVSWAFAPLQLISVILMLATERGQGLSDHVMGTAALNRRAI
ncbi:RDD family protein [Citreimonas salinaria]|uniref:RDD family protein n=1 Tax=Citreimonas salinaria TaxID=321339 RepID=A0A1H3GE17_9RHOB|nr:RDD family protein [Citreimonas salinaria]SDY01521.1 RDD family protein [Citreimonas salinaria]